MKKILIVDDDWNIGELLELRLKANGYETAFASNGVEAFARVQDEKPDLIILDAAMPVMDGYVFIQEKRWRPEIKHIPVLVLTAHTHTKDLFATINVSSFLTKPFQSKELLEKVSILVLK